MRLNQYLASLTNLSRRGADTAIAEGRVIINGRKAVLGQSVSPRDQVLFDGQVLAGVQANQIIALHKPVGYICSRLKQGKSPTIYALLPESLYKLKTVGRLDKDSSGLIILTNNGYLANKLAHPSFGKWKTYQVTLNKILKTSDLHKLEQGVPLEDGPSIIKIKSITGPQLYEVSLQEGRNRQIRRTFQALGYLVTTLHRTSFGNLNLDQLPVGKWKAINPEELI